MTRPLRIYIAGPYRADTPEQVDADIEVARQTMAALYRLGHVPFCPHSMTARFERDFPEFPNDLYLATDLVWLRFCDAILMLPRWAQSTGARVELALASRLGLQEFFGTEAVPEVAQEARLWAQDAR